MARPAAPAFSPGALERPSPDLLAELGLDEEQAKRIERLHSREGRRMEALQRSLADVEDLLRRAELEIPFDAERVNELVGRRAELGALLRGTESRVVAGIAALLEPEQQRRFAELRAGVAPEEPHHPPLPSEPPALEERGGSI